MSTDEQAILQFLKSQPMAVISTVEPGALQPEAALIAFAETDELEIIFETFVSTRKWRNLLRNPHVALVIGNSVTQQFTVQYEGLARAIPARLTEEHIKIFLHKDTPCTERFLRDPRVRLFKIKPTWIRCSDYTGKLPKIIEKTYIK